jgi:hypothetical protein
MTNTPPASNATTQPAKRYLVVIHIDKDAIENVESGLEEHIKQLSEYVVRFGGEQYNDALATHFAQDRVVLYHIFNDEVHVKHFCEFAEQYLINELGIPKPEITTFFEVERRIGILL